LGVVRGALVRAVLGPELLDDLLYAAGIGDRRGRGGDGLAVGGDLQARCGEDVLVPLGIRAGDWHQVERAVLFGEPDRQGDLPPADPAGRRNLDLARLLQRGGELSGHLFLPWLGRSGRCARGTTSRLALPPAATVSYLRT